MYNIVAVPAKGTSQSSFLSQRGEVTTSLIAGGVVGSARTKLGARIARAYHARAKTRRGEFVDYVIIKMK